MASSYWFRHPRVARSASLLRAGAVVAYPTEAVWGLGCDPMNQQAVERVLALKSRDVGKGLILIAAELDQLAPMLGSMNPEQRQMLLNPGPMPITWLVPASHQAPAWISGGRPTIAVRVTRFPLAAALCRAFGGPLVSTSANPSGLRPARDALKVRAYFRGQLDDVLPGKVGSGTRPSEIRDIATGKIIRSGDPQ